jgi:hypothetical protein
MEVKKIEKEQIRHLKFPKKDVLSCPNEQNLRKSAAERARILGNNEKCKVDICFDSIEGTYLVSTTIWDVDNDFITLKCATVVPLRTIRYIA